MVEIPKDKLTLLYKHVDLKVLELCLEDYIKEKALNVINSSLNDNEFKDELTKIKNGKEFIEEFISDMNKQIENETKE